MWTRVLSLQMDGKTHVKCTRTLSLLGNRLENFPKTYLTRKLFFLSEEAPLPSPKMASRAHDPIKYEVLRFTKMPRFLSKMMNPHGFAFYCQIAMVSTRASCSTDCGLVDTWMVKMDFRVRIGQPKSGLNHHRQGTAILLAVAIALREIGNRHRGHHRLNFLKRNCERACPTALWCSRPIGRCPTTALPCPKHTRVEERASTLQVRRSG